MTARTIASRPVFALLLSVVLARPVGSQQKHRSHASGTVSGDLRSLAIGLIW